MSKVHAAVKAVITNNENKLLAIKQIIGDFIVWDLPGGKVEHGENPYETLIREVKEETYLDVTIKKIVGIWWFFRTKLDNHQVVCTTFLCSIDNSNNVDLTKNPADENISEFKWVTKEEFLTAAYPVSNESLKQLIKDLEL